MELKITDEKVRAIAAKHPVMKDTLKEVFPEAFPSEYLEFKAGQVLGTYDAYSGIAIGAGFAPKNLSGKCLVWDKEKFEAEVGTTIGCYGYIAFKKLK